MRRHRFSPSALARPAQIFIVVAASVSPSWTRAQAPDLTVTTSTGKVLTFQTADQKAKFLAARERAQQAPPAQPAMWRGAKNPLPFITLDAVKGGAGTDFTLNWLSGYGSYDVSTAQSANVDVRVRNMSREKVAVILRSSFFARGAKDHGVYLFAVADERCDLAPGETMSRNAGSGLIKARDQNYIALGEQILEGAKYDGWVMQILMADSEVLVKQVGSSGYLEDWTKTADFADRAVKSFKVKPEAESRVAEAR